MKKKTGNTVKLGVFIFTGMVLFIAGIYFIGKKQQLFNPTFHISGIFKDINGLQVGNNIRFCGINVGIVDEIEQITDSTVKVDMLIDEHSRKFIKKNARALIGSDGLMGNKIITLIPGETASTEISNNDIIETARHVNMDDILLKVKVTSDNAASITGDLSAIMKNIHEGKGTIGKLFTDTVFAKNLDQTILNIKQGTKGFEQNMDAAKNSFLLRSTLRRKNKKENSEEKKQTNQ